MKQFLKSKKSLYELEHSDPDKLHGDSIYLKRYGENNNGHYRVRPVISSILDLKIINKGVPIRSPNHRELSRGLKNLNKKYDPIDMGSN